MRDSGLQPGRVRRLRIAVVRGAALNPFEMQSYRHLGREFDMLLVGRRKPTYEVHALGLPVRLLHATDEGRIAAAVSRRLGRLNPRAAPGRLLGLEAVVRGHDILHAAETAMPFSEQCAAIASTGTSKLVLTCWENIPFRFEEDPVLAERKRIVRDACTLFIAVTPGARSALIEEGVSEERIAVIPAGIDTARFAPRRPDRELLRRLGVPPGAFVLLFVGRMIQEKGVVELVRALARMPPAGGRAIHLVLAGDGPEASRVAAAAAALGCADRVHLNPSVRYADVPALYACADTVIAPSLSTPYWQEQFGMVLAEAMACGRPLITTSSGSIPDVVGDAAVLVVPYDVDALAHAIDALVSDESRRDALAAAGRIRAVSEYDSELVAGRLAAAYRRIEPP